MGTLEQLRQLEDMAEAVAEKTVNKIFLSLGVDAKDPAEVRRFQKDLAHLRSWRENTEAVQRRGMLALVTVLVTSAVGWFITYIIKWHI